MKTLEVTTSSALSAAADLKVRGRAGGNSRPTGKGVQRIPSVECGSVRTKHSSLSTHGCQKQQTPVTIASCIHIQALQQTGSTKDAVSPPTQHSALIIQSV